MVFLLNGTKDLQSTVVRAVRTNRNFLPQHSAAWPILGVAAAWPILARVWHSSLRTWVTTYALASFS